ncbi:TetR/AcrR family transcriptional regulator [Rossellomorea vietnamensis]|uniref:TetR/AcrR family transcriptional regulator n=2 Tax=Rossellomorea TaxID=2837508 RepID=A0A5D4KBQ8_9BACI|nr:MULTISPECIES: TetR/AcrR family transcriptional regulator [Rossellomorea]TYR74200.1 TetR/AcrR family transcriptional regulator [Rossellomorea vietnamensis]TYS79722.1 TetR/AcrR family transcriptional regulator [Rossellomorea aquimaris]
MNKRKAILETAVELFGEHGYAQTSMQQIADSIGISKGSLYSFFQSKEDLIISIYEHYQQLVFERAYVVGLDGNLPDDVRLAKQFQVQFEGILEYKSYMKMHMRGDTAKNSDKLAAMEHRMRGRLFSWLEHNLLQMYGAKILPYKWDLMWMTQSIYSSYMMLLISTESGLQPSKLGDHIVRQISILAQDFFNGNSTPLLDDEIMQPFSVNMDRQGAFISFEKREAAWKMLYSAIHSLNGDSDDFLKMADRISEECRKSKPDELIIKGMFRLLADKEELRQAAIELEDELLP